MRKEILEGLLRRAAAAHHEYEKKLGKPDANWEAWYAEHMAAEIADGLIPFALEEQRRYGLTAKREQRGHSDKHDK